MVTPLASPSLTFRRPSTYSAQGSVGELYLKLWFKISLLLYQGPDFVICIWSVIGWTDDFEDWITIENGFPALDIRANSIGLPRPWHSQLTSAAAGQLVKPLKRRKKYFNFGPKTNLFQCVCILSQKIGIFNLTKHIKPDLYVFISTVPTFTCINENQSDP